MEGLEADEALECGSEAAWGTGVCDVEMIAMFQGSLCCKHHSQSRCDLTWILRLFCLFDCFIL